MKYRRGTLRAIDQICELTGGISRESMVQLMLLDGIAAAYRRLGIEDEPAVTADQLLRAVTETWASDLTGDELAAIRTVRAALQRIAELNSRDAPVQDQPDEGQDRPAGNSPA